MNDLVVLSEVRWGYFRTRKQFLLSRFPESWRVLFAQPPGKAGDDPWTPRAEGRVTTFTVPFLKPGTTSAAYERVTSLAAGRRAIEWLAERHLRSMLRRLGVGRDPVVMVSNIYAARALSRLPRKLLVYDFNDSPFQFAGAPRWAQDYWVRVRDQVDLFFVVSEHYRRELSRQTDRPLVVVGNGVEWEHFHAPMPVPPELQGLPRPLVGYVGLLSHFLDFEVLEALRRARGRGTLVLLGPPSPATAEAVRALAAREGVRVLEGKPYETLPGYMQALDVGLIPFRAADPFVVGINPNKVYQYLAAGIPVVTTPILDLSASPPALAYAEGPERFVAAVQAALAARPDRAACADLARPHDWSVKARQMVATIESRVGAR